MSSHTFYVDEAGNAGINYLDGEQPFQVAAGVMIANERADALRALINQACGATQEFLDPDRHGAVDWLPMHAIQAHRELSEALYDELPADVLRKFA